MMTWSPPEDARALFAAMTAQAETLPERLDHFAATSPDKIWLHYGEGAARVSYGETRRASLALAGGMARMGVKRGDRVAVLTRNSMISVLAMVACWRIGAVFAPINFNLTGPLLAYQLGDAAAALLLTDPAFLPALGAIRGDVAIAPMVLHIPAPGDHDHAPDQATGAAGLPDPVPLADLMAGPALAGAHTPGPFDAAALIYTSGTTGPAKGVLLGHRWINQYTFGQRTLMAPGDTIYCDLPMYHVGGAFSLVGRAGWMGETAGLWDRFSASAFWDRIAQCGGSSATLLDVMVPRLMAAPEGTADRDNPLARVHMQPFNARHHQFARRFGIDFMTVGFGQTESGSVFSAVIDEFPDGQGTPAHLWRGGSKDDFRTMVRTQGRPLLDGRDDLPKGIMGRPSALFDLCAVDESDVPVATGKVGQLALRPRFPGLILHEYMGKPEATAKALRNGWFHTGDAVKRIDEDADFYVFIDRMGGFFRVRGENVSSFEVETMLGRHPAVRAVAAVPIPAAEGDEDDVAAFIELHDGAEVTLDALHAHAAEHAPRYMRPKYLRIVDALPVTPTAKIEKYKLRAAILEELAAERALT
jgi:crotonobetaine/carnitine-CoA ligase